MGRVSTGLLGGAELPEPTAADEDWRYVACAPLAAATDAARTVPPAELRPWFGDDAAIVLVDGQARPPGPGDWPAGLAASISDLTGPTVGDPALGWPWRQGARQRLTVTRDPGRPLRLVCVATGGRSGGAVELELAPGVQADLAIVHVHLGAARAHTGGTIRLGRGARLRVSEIQATPVPGVLTTGWTAQVGQDAGLVWHLAATGGGLVRHRIDVDLAQTGSEFGLHAALAVRGTDQAHLVSRILHRHASPSRQLVKCLLDDAARTSFDGLIAMVPGADGSDADLQHRSLVRSPKARADSRPQLDIRADEVKAAHGATIGQLDPEEVRYLRMRGLDPAAAATLLGTAYLEEVLAAIPHAGVAAIARDRLKP